MEVPPFVIRFDVIDHTQPAEICGAVVQGVSIDVIDGRSVIGIGIGTKGLCYQTADQQVLGLSVLTERDALIPLVVHKNGKKPWRGMLQAHDPSHITDEILSLIPFDFAPFLIGKILNRFYLYHILSLFLEK